LFRYHNNLKKLKCFFSYETDNSSSQEREIRMPSRRTTTAKTTKTTKAFIHKVNGANDLKEYIQDIADAAQRIRTEFNQDLQGHKAVVKKEGSTHGSRDFKAHMTAVAHTNFVYEREKLNQFSKYLQAEMLVLECLSQLEHNRRMIVNQKQEKNTMLSMIKKGTGELKLKQIMLLPESSSTCCELEHESPTDQMLNALIDKIKQNHRTVSRNLLKQAETIMTMLRRHILAFKLAAEETIGEIIHHAEKCRAFIAHLRQLDFIEYCASAWWHESQKDAMDRNEYFVTVEAVGEPTDFDASLLQNPHNAFPHSPMSVLKVRVIGLQQTIGQENLICEYALDQQLAETIMTEQSLEAFRRLDEQQQRQHQQQSEEERRSHDVAATAWS